MTDFNSPLGWLDSIEFDTVLHVECLEYEHNERPNEHLAYNKSGQDVSELSIFLKEFEYELS